MLILNVISEILCPLIPSGCGVCRIINGNDVFSGSSLALGLQWESQILNQIGIKFSECIVCVSEMGEGMCDDVEYVDFFNII